MADTLLAHVVSKFTPRQWEDIATEGLRFLLEGNAGDAPANVVRPFVDLPRGLNWRAQVRDLDTGIPDLVGEDLQRRPVVMIEGKFWAQLTPHQPTSYLARQSSAFATSKGHGAASSDVGTSEGNRLSHVLVFLVPGQRQALVATELASRMKCSSHLDEGTGLHVLDNGELVVVVSWQRMLAEVHTLLAEVDDQVALQNLEQLVGLCDRADQEAILPFTDFDFDTATARRLLNFYDLVDRVTDELVQRGITTTSGLKATSTRAHYGRYQRHKRTGVEVQLNFSNWWWAHEYPSPLWLRVHSADPAIPAAWRDLVSAGALAHVAGPKDGFTRVALHIPRGVESHNVVIDLVRQTEAALSALPSSVADSQHAEPPENGEDEAAESPVG